MEEEEPEIPVKSRRTPHTASVEPNRTTSASEKGDGDSRARDLAVFVGRHPHEEVRVLEGRCSERAVHEGSVLHRSGKVEDAGEGAQWTTGEGEERTELGKQRWRRTRKQGSAYLLGKVEREGQGEERRGRTLSVSDGTASPKTPRRS